MNSKGQIGVGVLLGIFMAIIVAVALLPSIASNVEQGTRTNTGAVVVEGVDGAGLYTGILNTNVELAGQELVSVEGVTNRTTGDVIPAANYTIAECVRASDGVKGICYKATSTAAQTGTGVGAVNISYTYYPVGYMDDGASRSVFPLVILFAVLALAVFVLVPVIREISGFA